ncbi:MAG TPA: hypothetical protein VIO62_01150 [Candidatus Dormibacteraeota bacterium]|jgi:hypothetical protein
MRDFESRSTPSHRQPPVARTARPTTAEAVLELQRKIGNAAVTALLRTPDAGVAADAGTAPAATDADIAGLDLQEDVANAARELKKQIPAVQFNSGRRTLTADCWAVSKHIADDPAYVDIFVNSRPKRLIKAWVAAHPAATRQAIAAGLEGILEPMGDTERSYWSLHLGGRAFDVASGSATLADVRKVFPSAISEEGHWHVQFPSAWSKP